MEEDDYGKEVVCTRPDSTATAEYTDIAHKLVRSSTFKRYVYRLTELASISKYGSCKYEPLDIDFDTGEILSWTMAPKVEYRSCIQVYLNNDIDTVGIDLAPIRDKVLTELQSIMDNGAVYVITRNGNDEYVLEAFADEVEGSTVIAGVVLYKVTDRIKFRR